jgi:hypothetical protein
VLIKLFLFVKCKYNGGLNKNRNAYAKKTNQKIIDKEHLSAVRLHKETFKSNYFINFGKLVDIK